MVKMVECFDNQIDGVSTDVILPYKIAKVQKCGQASDDIARNMSCYCREINLEQSKQTHQLAIVGCRRLRLD